MTTSVDTNVWIALWDRAREISGPPEAALLSARDAGELLVTGVVFVELMGAPGRGMAELDEFFADTGTKIDWELGERVFRVAGEAYQGYVSRRRRSHGSLPRRVLADFLIGAHAQVNGHRLLTLDKRLYRAAFPKLQVVET